MLRNCFFVAIAAVAAACGQPAIDAELVIENVTIIPGDGGPAYLGDVAIADGAFAAVGEFEAGAIGQTINGEGLYLAPGLWDMHIHLASDRNEGLDPEALIRHGVTSVLDLGGHEERIAYLRDEIAAGRLAGPTIYAAGPTLNGESFGDFQDVVTTAEAARTKVRALEAWGADIVKIHRAFPVELMPELIREATSRELKVTGHIPLGMHPQAACEAGMAGVQHLGSILEAYVSVAPAEGANIGDAIAYMESDAAKPLINCLVERKVAVTPTLVIYPAIARSRTPEGYEIPAALQAHLDAINRIAGRLSDSGVAMLVGTDTAYPALINLEPGAAYHDELAILQAAGLEPSLLIRMATSSAAEHLGVDGETGSIAVGKAADFLLLKEDPLADIRNLRSIEAVYRKGLRVAGALTPSPQDGAPPPEE
ncbi:MAG: amidohydrolase family protein [Parvularculaceae bacterium]